MLQWALKYLSQGLSVIPLKQRGKEPLIDWKPYQNRRATEAEVKEWWKKWPVANIGIVTGIISNVVVIDLDGPAGISSASLLKLSSSAISLTGNGKHLWYRSQSSLIANSVRSYPGLDIRGEGGYCVVPPSIHESERRYRWLGCGVVSVESLPNVPSILLTAAKNADISHAVKEESWIAKALEGMKNGNIDDTLFTICSRLRADNWSSSDALVLLTPHAERVGATPGHLEEKIENVWARYEPNSKPGRAVSLPLQESGQGLIIHSPTNPASWKQFSERSGEESESHKRLNTGYSKLDQMFKGGLKSSRLFTVAARTGVGKTNWLLGVTKRLCMDGKRVLLFSTEMPYSQIWERYLATLEAPEKFTEHRFYVCDSFAPNLERVKEAIEQIRPDVFIFDHINHVAEEPRALGEFMQGLNFLRRQYDCAGIISAQLNRAADWVDIKTGEKVTPRMSMIKGSGTIEQASSRVLLLSETRVSPEGTEIVGNLDKNDNGSKGLVFFRLANNPYHMVEL